MWLVGVAWAMGVVLWASPAAAARFSAMVQEVMRVDLAEEGPRIIRICAICLVVGCGVAFALSVLPDLFPGR
jgi:hypothetical protein